MTLKITRRITISLLAFALISCVSTRDAIIGQQPEPVDPSAEFDLAEYLFHSQLNSGSNEATARYTETYFRKNSPPSPAARYDFNYRREGDTINVLSAGSQGVANQYTVSDTTITKVQPNIGDSRSFQRYARLGDTYLDAKFTPINVYEVCVLTEFFEQFHLRSATGSIQLSNESYDNVIKARCVSEFTDRATNRGNYRRNVYYAKGIGPVFKDGNWQNHLGQIYAIFNY